MLTFYRNFAIALLVLIAITFIAFFLGLTKSQLTTSLFPGRDSQFIWAPAIEPQVPQGNTALTVKNDVGTVEYEFFLDPKRAYAYTHFSMYFIEAAQAYRTVDLTRYRGISFKVQCDPKNVLLLVLFSFDDKVTKINDMATRRVSSTAFSCNNHWVQVNIAFSELDTPHWWLGRYGFDFSDQGYDLSKTMGIAWVNSLQSPLNTPSNVKLTDVNLVGTDSRYIYAASATSLALWILFCIWQFRCYIRLLTLDLKEKVKQDQPLIAYKKLSIEPQKDKEKSAVLRFVATEYANPELSLEDAATALGVNRTKINDILKEELGLTFSTYLNKLRLTEAARLLAEIEEANISEIAYSVGYNNVSYFNKLFKIEYGCAPKTFKVLYQSKDPS